MNIAIIGGAGFVGANLARYFADKDHQVFVMDNLVRRGSEINLRDLLSIQNITFNHGDARNKEDFKTIKKWEPDIVLNCAAQPAATNYKNPEFDITNNTVAQLNVLELCRELDIPHIFWSTNKIYPATFTNKGEKEGNSRLYWDNAATNVSPYWSPTLGFKENTPINAPDHSVYGVSKAMSDLLTQEYSDAFGILCYINRFSCLAGPNQWGKAEQGWVAWFCIAHMLDLPLTFYGFNGKQVRDCLFTEDLNLLIDKQISSLLSSSSPITKAFNVGGGSNNTISLIEVLNILNEISPKKIQVTYGKTRRADQPIYISDITSVSNTFQWQPSLDVKSGIEQIYKWAIDNEEIIKHLYG
jgi:CDP-paratose 2-epimerase